jgi:uncharacterized membrane protein YbaN (DUF454 family)
MKKRTKPNVKKYALLTLGFLALAVGAVGIFMPILPTTPFVICAAACFGASSPKLARRLENNRFFGEYIRNYRDKSGISRKTRIRGLVFLWTALIISAIAFRHVHVWIILSVVGVAVSIHILTIRAANKHLRNLNRIEFIVTYACTGQCKHCSEGEHRSRGEHIDGGAAAEAIRKIAGEHNITSVMTFGGEPLLYADAVCEIHAAARDAGIGARQIITNGFFTRDDAEIERVAKALVESGVNDVLLSVDAFHQETIPLEYVMKFAKSLISSGIPKLRTHPAWLVSADADNPYNNRTRELLREFESIGIAASDGNVIFPAGNALKYLGEYLDLSANSKNPYKEDPRDVRSISFNPAGESSFRY